MVKVKENIKVKRKPLKGAVLFTVLCVMVVVLIIMIATIGLSGLASRRAYKEYHDAQIASTGRSIVQSVLQSIKPGGDNSDIGDEIYAATTGSPGTPYTVQVSNGGNLGNGLGTVEKLEFTYVGIDDESDYFIMGSVYPVMKVTATVRMGSEVTTYSEYVSGLVSSPGGGGDGGLIGTNSIDGTGTGMNVLGPVGGGLNNGKASGTQLSVTNAGVYTGVQFFNSSLYINTHKAFLYGKNVPAASYDANATSDYNGLFVLGNVEFQNQADFLSDYTGASDKETPYIFATGRLYFPNRLIIGACMKNTVETGSVDNIKLDTADVENRFGNKINVYCGSIETKDESMEIYAVSDIYCYDETKESKLGGKGDSKLIDWTSGVLGKSVYDNQIKGNFKTKGSLSLGRDSSVINITGDLYVGKTLTIVNNGPTVNGKVSAHILKLPVTVGSVDDIKAFLHCSAVEFDYVIDSSNVCRKSDFSEVTYKSSFENQASSMPTSFPSDKELDKILGINFNAGVGSSGSEQLAAVDNQNYNITGASLVNKIIQNPSEMNNRFYVEDPNTHKKTLKGSVGSSGADNTNVYTTFNGELEKYGYKKFDGVWYGKTTETEYNANLTNGTPNQITVSSGTVPAVRIDYKWNPSTNANDLIYYKYLSETGDYVKKSGSEFIIDESCVLSGNYQNVTIRVKPGTDPNNPLWIELADFNLSGNGKIVVEDMQKDINGHFITGPDGKNLKNAPVYFYIRDNSTVTFDGTKLITDYYDQNYFNGSNALTAKLTVPVANIPNELKPGIYIYGNNTEFDNNNNPIKTETLKIINNAVVTAYIVAPRCELDVTNAGNSGADINYNGKNYNGLKAGIIGSAIVGNLKNAQNDVTLVYINNSDGTTTSPLTSFAYEPIPGFSSY